MHPKLDWGKGLGDREGSFEKEEASLKSRAQQQNKYHFECHRDREKLSLGTPSYDPRSISRSSTDKPPMPRG
jgi:hypothetical protein